MTSSITSPKMVEVHPIKTPGPNAPLTAEQKKTLDDLGKNPQEMISLRIISGPGSSKTAVALNKLEITLNTTFILGSNVKEIKMKSGDLANLLEKYYRTGDIKPLIAVVTKEIKPVSVKLALTGHVDLRKHHKDDYLPYAIGVYPDGYGLEINLPSVKDRLKETSSNLKLEVDKNGRLTTGIKISRRF